MIEEYIDKIIENGSPKDMENLSEMLEDIIYKLKDYNEECFDKYKMKLYVMAYGKVLTREMAEKIVKEMKPYAEHWNYETTTAVKNQFGIKDISDVDFYITMNKSYNDNYDTVEKFADTDDKKLEMYISLTKDFVLDADAKEGKTFTYFTVIPK